MNKSFYLVFQAGIANVFEQDQTGQRARVKQADFQSCRDFCRGLRYAGANIRAAWCNEAGDIIKSNWNFQDFDRAPFCEKFPLDFMPENERDYLEERQNRY